MSEHSQRGQLSPYRTTLRVNKLNRIEHSLRPMESRIGEKNSRLRHTWCNVSVGLSASSFLTATR